MKVYYNISAKGKIIFENLSEEDFHKTWKELNNFVSIYTDVNREDLSFHKVEVT